MLQFERQEILLRHVNQYRKADVRTLGQLLGVSMVTVRRDIDDLAAKGLVMKTHGGVLSARSGLAYEIPFAAKSEANIAAKRSIGLAAAGLAGAGETIIIDSGSTTLEMARQLEPQPLTVLTNDLMIAVELAAKRPLQLIVAGGTLQESVYALTGNQTIDFFRSVHVDKAFMGCDAIDLSFGISNRSMEEVAIKRAMMDAADQVILLTDSSKLNSRVFSWLCGISRINTLVVDQLDESFRAGLEQAGVAILLASPELEEQTKEKKKNK